MKDEPDGSHIAFLPETHSCLDEISSCTEHKEATWWMAVEKSGIRVEKKQTIVVFFKHVIAAQQQ